MDRRPNRGELDLDRSLAQLLYAACPHRRAIAYEGAGLAIPLGIDPVDRVLEHRGRPVVVLGGDEHEAVGLSDRGGPSLHDLVLVGRAARHGWRQWLIEERHRKVAQVEEQGIDLLAFLQVLQDPVRGLFREAALAGAADNDGNGGHAFNPWCSFKTRDRGGSDHWSLFFLIQNIGPDDRGATPSPSLEHRGEGARGLPRRRVLSAG